MANKLEYTIRVVKEDEGSRFDRFLSRRYNELNFNAINIMCRKGIFRVNGSRVKSSYRLNLDDIIKIPPNIVARENDDNIKRELSTDITKELHRSLIFKDDYLLAINKWQGLATQGGSKQGNNHLDAYRSTLRFGLSEDPKLVHRLDKDTSGIIVLARDTKTARKLTEKFREREITKFYWALVRGSPDKDSGVIESQIGEEEIWRPKKNFKVFNDNNNFKNQNKQTKPAVTYFKVIDRIGAMYSWLLLMPSTGRTHQLRIHTSLLGCPIIGDKKYINVGDEVQTGYPEEFRQLFLHARCLIFNHPKTGKRMELLADPPENMLKVWRFFGWNTENKDFLRDNILDDKNW